MPPSLLLAALLAPAVRAGDPEAPAGFTRVEVVTVLPAGNGGGTVMLADAPRTWVVPIAVGSSEALTIALRSERRRYERPLTHDLLDAVLRELGGEVSEIRIDDLRSSTFVATMSLREGRRESKLDLRASDAIAVALGHDLPIWIADAVVAQTRLPWGDLTPPPAPAEPQPEL